MHYAIALGLVAVICYVNVRGIHAVGVVSTILEVSVLAVVGALCVVAALEWQHNPFSPLVPPHAPRFRVFGAGLALGLWLYSGYEQLSSVAEEVENPQRTYPRALVTVVPLSVATYFLPTLFSLAVLGNWEKWHTGYFSTAAQLIGGSWLGIPITIGAMIGNVALLNATVLTSTRMPSTMAEDGYLPAAFSARHPRYGTPWIAIIASSVVHALLAQKTMGATADGLLVAAHWRDGFDGAGFVALAKDKTRDAAAVSDSVGPCGAILCGGGAAGDECGSVGGKRSLCAQVGARTGAASASNVFCD